MRLQEIVTDHLTISYRNVGWRVNIFAEEGFEFRKHLLKINLYIASFNPSFFSF